jgi:hypothetical protein
VEQLLFLLFILFSVVSALLDRRKKRLAEEERQARRRAQRTAPEPPAPVAEPEPARREDAPEELGWPFGDGPVEVEYPRPRPAEQPIPEASPPELTVPELDQALARQLQALEDEREALVAERRALELERLAAAAAREATERRGRRRVPAPATESRLAPSPPSICRGRWTLDPARARDGVVYAEILGPPVGFRQQSGGAYTGFTG